MTQSVICQAEKFDTTIGKSYDSISHTVGLSMSPSKSVEITIKIELPMFHLQRSGENYLSFVLASIGDDVKASLTHILTTCGCQPLAGPEIVAYPETK